MKKKLFALLLIAGILAMLFAGCSGESGEGASNDGSSESEWPNKTIEVVVTAGAGGDTDFNARTFATYFEKYTGQSMVVSNNPGGGGSVATSQVKNSNPDGYRMLFCHTGQMIINEVAELIDYSMDEFDIAGIPAVDKGTVLVASKESGITSVEDLVAKAQAEPGSITYASELGGYSHLQGLLLMDKADIDLRILDIGSASDKITNMLGGRVDLAAITYGAVKDYAETGDLVILAQYNNDRNENLGDIPTFKESGIDMVMEKPYIIAFPKGTDAEIIEKMNEVIEQIASDADYEKDLLNGYKQPVDYLLKDDAISLLKDTREDYMQYRQMLTE
ncbi:tripartite tricarboxylate transporter substrate binding protein [Alkalibacter mobilis]|uniref:tripartite tricarboxylate transporter substrate binding protein n=1 Tax=Alkalibacter mobilis TaxID=2787712 RepID=UPI00189E4859|nr:tripartite tricarboxylate transporter substrate binding protein [Alkalibacter mobilis]MBF7096643.1 tripartite tricarboxylate transporter substrate binding protein [Alkalibacter mobilis]